MKLKSITKTVIILPNKLAQELGNKEISAARLTDPKANPEWLKDTMLKYQTDPLKQYVSLPFDLRHNPASIIPKVEDNEKLNTVPYPRYSRISSKRVNEYRAITYHTRARPRNLHINSVTYATCVETGIHCSVDMPSPIGVNLEWMHPLALFRNVESLIEAYQKTGRPLVALAPEVLAGILITIMKHKDFTKCEDGPAANARLRLIGKETLVYAINYFFKASSRRGLPRLALYSKDGIYQGHPTEQMLQYIKICQGEDESLVIEAMQEKKKVKIKARSHKTQEEKEYAQAQEDIKACEALLERRAKGSSINSASIESLGKRIKRLAVLNTTERDKLVADIKSILGDNDDTHSMALIILSVDTTEIEKSLNTWEISDAVAALNNTPVQKVDLLALLRKQQGKAL